ncbi:hypothetical protein EC968_003794 [Mortierella alpina]|nr:hypothetical protein EC968_003794 [Mortierella alpina]
MNNVDNQNCERTAADVSGYRQGIAKVNSDFDLKAEKNRLFGNPELASPVSHPGSAAMSVDDSGTPRSASPLSSYTGTPGEARLLGTELSRTLSGDTLSDPKEASSSVQDDVNEKGDDCLFGPSLFEGAAAKDQLQPSLGERFKTQSEYWRTALAGAPVLLDLPTDRPRPSHQSFKGDRVPFELNSKTTRALKELSQHQGVTLFMTILSAWSAVLSRLSGQDDIVIGTPTPANTLALRVDLSGKPTTQELLDRVRRTTLSAFTYQDMPFEQVVEILQPPRKMDHTPLFQVLYSWRNQENSPDLASETAKFDLTLTMWESDNTICGSLGYSTALFDRTSIEKHVGYLQAMLLEMTADNELPVALAEILSLDERTFLLETLNVTAKEFSDSQHIHQLFERQVQRIPNNIAVVHESQSLTYSELNERANRLAHHLIHLGVQPDTMVPICVERSLALIVGILAILKAGGAYVPLDPVHASERLIGILEDVGSSVLVADTCGMKALQGADLSQLKMVDPNSTLPTSAANPRIAGLSMHHLAYVIYTSGTTGKPKGVMVEHRQVARLFAASATQFEFSDQDTWCLLHSPAFDFSVWEMWGALRQGGKLIVVSQDVVRTPHELYQLLQEQAVTVLNMTPTAFKPLLDIDTANKLQESLRYLILGGEALSPAMLKPWLLPNAQRRPEIINLYGPTEICVYVTYSRVSLEDCSQTTSSIGGRLPDMQTYVLDQYMRPVPLGVVGELYVGGAGVSRGYFKRPELSAERFLQNPFTAGRDERIYRTGDLVRQLSNGSLLYMGRNDHQVKIRGFRIELGEIEARLADHPLISEAVVIATGDDSSRRLVAYVTVRSDELEESSSAEQLASSLRAHLSTQLPDYMVPSAFVKMDVFPMTTNGKLDVRALPAPKESDFARQAYVPPQGELETTIASIWSELLQMERVSRHDSFFALGGHSLLAVQVISKLHALGHSVSASILFESPTLSAFAHAIGQQRAIVVPPNLITPDVSRITPELLPLIDLNQDDIDRIVEQVPGGLANIQDIYALAPLQEGILFHHLMHKTGDPYLLYYGRAFDNRALLDQYLVGMQQMVDRHDILRTAFFWEDLSTPAQVVLRSATLSTTELTLDSADGSAIEQLKQRCDPRYNRLDLTKAPLLHYTIAQDFDGRWILGEWLHHMLGDHSTLEHIELEIRAIQQGRGSELLAPHPYRNLIAQTRLGVSQDEHEKFFRNMLSDFDTPSLPFGITDVRGDGSNITEATRMLPADLNDRLRFQAKRLGVSLASLCHVAWAQVIARTSGQQRVVFGTVLFGRMSAETSSEGAIGLYINTLPFRVDVDSRSVEESVQETHALLAKLLEHEHAPLALAQRCSDVEPGVPLFTSLLNYRHNMESPEHGSGMEFLGEVERTNYPYDLSIEDYGTSLGLTAQVMLPLVSDRACGYMQEALDSLASALEYNPKMSVSKLDVLPAEERKLLTQGGQWTQEDDSYHVCLHELFEQYADRVPNALSVMTDKHSLTYAEMNAESNRLAHRLIDLGAKPDSVVGLCMERSSSMIVAMFGILKSGAAYLPLDPTYTGERLKDIVGDAAPTILVTDAVGRKALGALATPAMVVLDMNDLEGDDTSNPLVPGLRSGNLAYMIYTSGSTGKPKGVMVEHKGVASLAQYHSELIGIHEGSRMLQFASISFDFSVWEIFLTLCSGATLVLAPSSIRMDRNMLWNYMMRQSVTHATFTPSFLQDGVDFPCAIEPLTLTLGGEALGPTLLQNLIQQGIAVFNDYGPTESSISAATWKGSADFNGDVVPIGRPVRNSRLYVLDAHQEPVPLGAVGELYISGVGLARGYLNRPEQTAERFLKNPFGDNKSARMYRTGDLVRYLPDGDLVYLGRTDYQVKIRGFRIELGEIEVRLAEHPMVSEAFVLALGEGINKRLVAYLTTDPEVQIEALDKSSLPSLLRSHLSARLPEYMVPSAFVCLDAFPLTSNGKLDRKALPAPSEDDYARQAYEAPEGEVETAIASIWSELLDLKRVSRHDSFFALGGHSLLAVQVISRLHRLGHSVSVRTLFESPTLLALAQSIGQHKAIVVPPNVITPDVSRITPEMLPLIDLNQDDIDRIVEQVPGGVANIQDIYALSPLQDGILFHNLMHKVGDPYLLYTARAFDNRKVLDQYLAATQQIMDRHDILRTAFMWENLSVPAQVVLRSAPLPVTELTLDPADGPVVQQLKQRLDPRHNRIDLTKAPLMRFTIAQDPDGRWILGELLHHLTGDHSTLEVIEAELLAIQEGRGAELLAAHPYRNLIAQARLGVSQVAHEKFFKEMLSDFDTPSLPFGITEVRGDGSNVTESGVMLPSELNERLRFQAKRLGVSVASLCHVAWAQVIARTSGQQQVVFGTVLFGRMQAETSSDRAIGLYINTLPLRVDVDNRSVEECVQLTHSLLAKLLEHEHASLALAQRCSSVQHGVPLFNSLLNYRHNMEPPQQASSASGMELLESLERTNYPFTISVEDYGTSLGLTAQVAQPLESRRACAYMQEALRSLTSALEGSAGMSVSRLNILPSEEHQLLTQGGSTQKHDNSYRVCLHQLFEQHVTRAPDNLSIVCGDQALTYAELNAYSNRLAHRLIENGVQTDSIVALCMDRSPSMIIAMLAILKAGAAYLPLDPHNPSDRLQDIVTDANPAVLVTDSVGTKALGDFATGVVIEVDVDDLKDGNASNPQISDLDFAKLAYVIYTSGSTGKPKGVLVEHQGVASIIQYHSELLHVREGSRMLQFASITFDFSVWEIFIILCSGATLVLAPSSMRMDRDRLWNYMNEVSVTHAACTPSFLQDGADLPSLDRPLTLSLGGEAVTPALLHNLIRQGINVFNLYGPTETSIATTTWNSPADFRGDIVPIGSAVRNARHYILDDQQRPVPMGATGELYIGGVGLARGYLNRPDLTAERFLKDPFSDDEDARVYRTGDLVRQLPDGNLMYLGRADFQVKIRGFRIELGEIEAKLVEHEAVSEAVVVALGEGVNARLVAYFTRHHDEKSEAFDKSSLPSVLRSHLSARLPDYMVPSAFVKMDAFRLLTSGKLDRRSLPAPSEDDYARQAYEAPQGAVESAIASVWSELLNVNRVSRHDSFFALGGHSLLAVQVISRLHGLGHSVSVRALFESPTLSALAQSIGQHKAIVVPPNVITPGVSHITPEMLPLIDLNQDDIDRIVEQVPGGVANIQDIYALAPLQDGILFHHLMHKVGDPYILYSATAFDNRASVDQYLAATQQIVDRHDILRTAFMWENLSTPAQVVLRSAPLSITELFLDTAKGPVVQQLQKRSDPRFHRMDLTQAPLLKFTVAQDVDGRWVVSQLLHHLIGDHSTLEVIELEMKAIKEGRVADLLAPHPYRNLIAQARLGVPQEAHEKFFKEMLSDFDTPSLPFGVTDVRGDGSNVTESERDLSAELNERLRFQAKRLGVSLASLCHVAWAQVIARTSGQQQVVFGTVLFGRMQAETSSGQAMGLYINTLPLRVDVDNRSVEESVQQTHSRLAKLLEHEHASLTLAQRCSDVEPGVPLFSSLLNYRHNSEIPVRGSNASGKEEVDSRERTNYPFSISVEDYGTALGLTAQAVQPLDSDRACGYMQEALDSLASALESNPKMPVAKLNVLPAEERTLLLDTWNDNAEDYPEHLCLHQLFEQQVERTPDALAVVCGDKSLTYRELNARSNGLAHHLVELGVRTDDVVAICVERSVEMIVSMLAVYKAGGAYVPLDPFFASERLKDIMSDAAPNILLADEAGRTALGSSALSDVTVVDPASFTTKADNPPHVPGLISQNLAYVIYTSGTTGKPKGVMVEHQGVVNLVVSQQQLLNIQPASRMTQFMSISFDPSVWETFATISYGGTLHVLQEEVRRDFRKLWDYLQLNQITHSIFTPTVMQDCEGLPPLESMAVLMIGGEALSGALVRKVGKLVPNAVVVNEYGPTEASIAALSWTYVEGGLIGEDIVPIGRPLACKRAYVLDREGLPLPLGVAGELYLGGVGVARGYLNRPDLTSDKFGLDPYSREPGARMYKTGDMAKYHTDGRVICLGRNDDQIKIRGFRVELGEIEARLVEHPLVSEAAVVPLGKGGNMRLAAYVIARNDVAVEAASASLATSLRAHLLEKLPDYMVPSAFVSLSSFPLTTNGKLDRRALPAPSEEDYAREAYEAPQGKVEIALAAIWSELLQVNRVSRNDSFFGLGGHSLLAVRLVNRVSALGASVAISTLFAAPTLAAFASRVQEQLAQEDSSVSTITRVSRDSDLPLSFAQQRLWFLGQLGGVSDTYHMPLALRLQGQVNQEALEYSLSELCNRHEALRSVFVTVNGQAHVKILPPGGLSMRKVDLRGVADQDIQLKQWMDKETHASFDLEQGPLVRASLIQIQDDESVLLITQHHIVSDGWSVGIMLREMSQLYTAYCNGESNPLSPLRIQYPDYAAWQRQWLAGDQLKSQSDYWRTALAGAPVLLDLPTDHPRPPHQSFKGDRVTIAWDAQITRAAKQLSQKHGVTLFMTILSAWSAVLSHLSGQDDIVIGTPNANRNHPEIEALIGFFVNTLALRIDLSGKPTTQELLERVRRSTLAALNHQDLPFEQVVEAVQPPRKMDHTPLFQVMFAWQNNEDEDLELQGLKVAPCDLDYDAAKFDLTLSLWEEEGGIGGNLEYSTALFDRETIERHVGYVHAMLLAMTADEEQPVAAAEILSQDERTLLLKTLNVTVESHADNRCLHQLFEQRVEDAPDSIAVVHEDQSLTYGELNARANRLAHHLMQLGVKPDSLVAICVDRSLPMLVGVLAILKAGGAYVPLDPVHASSRLLDILDDVQSSIVLVDERGMKALQGSDLSHMEVVDLRDPLSGPTHNPQVVGLSSSHLAYVIYTSGSTGKPKGVMVEHQQVARLFTATSVWFDISEQDTWCLLHSFAFDFSVWEIWGAFLYGGKLVVVSQDIARSPQELYRTICEEAVTVLNMTPSAFKQLIDIHSGEQLDDSLRYVVFGGEALAPAILKPWFHTHAPDRPKVVNMYGITETTVHVTYRLMTPEDCSQTTSPIGVRIPDLRTYVLNNCGNPVPLGVMGELFVGGEGVTRGYLNRPDLTSDRFIPDPFVEHKGRMYKTGDLVKQLPDGSLVYMGRNDHQVKIRGFRIELGEIEARLTDHPRVIEAVVIPLGDERNKRLVAYVSTREGEISEEGSDDTDSSFAEQLASTLRTHLSTRLPEYMIPSAFVHMVSFPLTPSGKLDMRALPAPSEDNVARQAYEAPEGEIETAIASIWSELLQIERVSRHDSFFALGGHSLLAVQVISKLHRVGHSVSVRALFEAPTLAVFAASIGHHHAIVIPPNVITPSTTSITPEMLPLIDLTQTDIDHIVEHVPGGVSNIQDIYSLSPLQDGILFHHLMAKSGDPYLLYVAMRFDTRASLDQHLAGMQKIVNRHDILRTAFMWENLSTPAQVVWRDAPVTIMELDLDPSDGPILQQMKQRFDPLHYKLDLTQAPVLRFAVAQDVDGQWILVRLLHHLVEDNSTLKVLHSELQTFCENNNAVLPPAEPYRNLIAQARLGMSQQAHEKFFKAMLEDIDTPSLPFGMANVHGEGANVIVSDRMLPQSLNDRLRNQAKRLGVSVASLCHVAWAQVIARTSGQQRVVFGTVLFGRMQAETSADQAMGLYINTLPIRVDIDSRSVEESVQQTHALLAKLLEHEHAPLTLAQRCSGIPSGGPLFSSLLNYRHSEDDDEEEGGEEDMELLDFQERINYPFGISVEDLGTSLGLTAQVASPLNSYRVCSYMQEAMESLANALESDPSMSVAQLDVLPLEERTLLLETWNDSAEEYPDSLCLHHMFEQQAQRTPDAIAAVHGDQSVTYRELNARANGLAHHLVQHGIQPDERVAICVKRSPEMLVGIMAILKVGGAYVPLDPLFASDRLKDIINDAAPRVLLADEAGRTALGKSIVSGLIAVDPTLFKAYAGPSPCVTGLTCKNLAYVIYTSGTTGKPKGVLVEHQGVVNLLTSRQKHQRVKPSSNLTQFFSYSFDASILEIFGSLSFGGTLHILQEDVRLDFQQLWTYMDKHQITHAALTPAVLQNCEGLSPLASMSTLIIGGESLSEGMVRKVSELMPNAAVVNEYGPTEATVATLSWKYSKDGMIGHDLVPVGRPLANKRVYLLDDRSRPVPLGAVGELYIGGVGIARGYLNRPDLTAEKFLVDPFARESGAVMYRTGDLAKYHPDGNVICLGRNDDQVKIRGFRVELGEIEARLAEHPQVSEAVVVPMGEGSLLRLVAYIIARTEDVPEQTADAAEPAQLSSELRSHLATKLPDYMVPSAFVTLSALPLTSNGKLDRRALPAPSDDDYAREAYEAPQGEIEKALALIWCELLQLKRVSRNDSFFALGGHSLLAVQVISRLHRLGHSVSVRALFDSPTLSALAESIGQHHAIVVPPNYITPGVTRITPEMLPLIDLSQMDIDHIVERVPGGVSNVQDIYALSPLQDGILFHHLMQKTGDPYLFFTARSFDTRHALDMHLDAMQQIVDRHDILRTSFMWEGLSTPAQVVWRTAPLSITELDLDLTQGSAVQQLQKKFDPRFNRIDLSQAPLLRLAAAQDLDGRWILMELLHHTIGDHSTLETTEIELREIQEGRGADLIVPHPYRNLIAQARLGVSQEAHEKFFKEMLADFDTPSLPFGITDIFGDGSQVTECHRMLPQGLNDRLRNQAKRLGVSVASMCHVAWAQVIARTSGQQRVVFGTVLFGRMQAETSSDQAMGLYINTLPFRVDVNNASVEESVQQAQSLLAKLLEHEHASLTLAQSCSGIPSGSPLFNSLLNYRHNNAEVLEEASNNPEMDILNSQERTNYPLGISVEDFGTSLGLTTQAVLPLDPGRICGYMQEALDSLASALEFAPKMPVAQLNAVPAEECNLLLQAFNDTAEDYPSSLCLHRMFEHQVERTPEATAVIHEDESLTYSELNVRANRLAHRLIQLGVHVETLVAICVKRSPEMLVAVLAVLKAGGAYVPLDPLYSSDRLKDIVRDAAPSVLIADDHGRKALGDSSVATLPIVNPNTTSVGVQTNPNVDGLTSHNLAYVIYTSGTTGTPKGVMVEHHGVVNLVSSRQKQLLIEPTSRMTMFFSVSFDPSLLEIFGTLGFGGALHILGDDIRQDKNLLWKYLENHRITHAILTPAMLQELDDSSSLSDMRVLLIGGEALSAGLARKAKKIVANGAVINEYGPTEASIAALSWRYAEHVLHEHTPIGRPFSNRRVYLLDAHGTPVPLGAIGEIYLGGLGVARGYLNRPDLTAENFLADPFSGVPGARMYKTGDLGRFLPDGNVVCLGRNDHQVKIRGFRIELGEIEAKLAEHTMVSEVVVVTSGSDASKQLVAYVVATQEYQMTHEVDAEDFSSLAQFAATLRSYLMARLPEYMVPAAFVRLDALPLTPNGKLDRNALPTPLSHAFATQVYEEPRGAIENILASIWAEMLNIERVGRNDGFFVLGGYSLLAVRMISRVRAMLGLDLSLRTLFEAPTIAELAPRLLATGVAHDESYDVLLPIKPQGSRPPLFCVHPGTGLSWCYTGLSAQLDMDQPLYGLQARGLIDNGNMASSLDEMVLDYVDQIRRIQPHGPYHLLGYSFGGLVAHTMASYLEKQGEQVALVALMDTRADYQTMSQEEEGENQQEHVLIRTLSKNRNLISPDMISPILKKALQAVDINNSKLGKLQAPRVTSGDLVIFRATVMENEDRTVLDPNAWKPYVQGSIEVCDVKCAHDFMDMPEATAMISQVLNQKLRQSHCNLQKEE